MQLHEEFPARQGLIYLNSGNLSLTPQSVLAAENFYRRQFEENPTSGLAEAWGKLWRAQSELADFLGARKEDLFLRANVTEVLNAAILGASLPHSSEILVSDLEYGAIQNICRFRAEKEGHAFRLLKLPQSILSTANLTSEDLTDYVVSQLSSKTKMLVLSHVIAGTGLILPILQIAEETRKRNVLLVVDGAYAPGALRIDFREFENVDFYGCSLYKWMMGPKGTAFGWVHPHHQEKFVPQSVGWMTYQASGPFADFGEGCRFQQRMCLQGCRDFSPFFALKEMLEVWRAVTPENILADLKDRQSLLVSMIEEKLRWTRFASSKDVRVNGPLLTFLLPEKFQSEGDGIAQRIRTELGIQLNTVSLNGKWHLIFSPHFYNTRGEIANAVERLATL